MLSSSISTMLSRTILLSSTILTSLILLLFFSLSSVLTFVFAVSPLDPSSSTFDISSSSSSSSSFQDQTLTSSEHIITFFGTISDNTHFTFKNIIIPAGCQIFFNVSISSNNATLEISDTSFPSSLRIVVNVIITTSSFSSSSSSATIRLKNVRSFCKSQMSSRCTTGSEGSKLSNRTANFFLYTPTIFAALVEVRELFSSSGGRPVPKSSAPSINIVSENSSYEIVDDLTTVNSSSSLVAFGIQRFHHSSSPEESNTFTKFSLGAGTLKTSSQQQQQQHTTILPFVSAHFSSSHFICMSHALAFDSATPQGPAFIACLVIGNNFDQDITHEKTNQRALSYPLDFQMTQTPFWRVTNEVPFYQETAGFNTQLLVDTIWISDGCTFRGSCSGSLLCEAIGVSQVIFQRIVVEDVSIVMDPCYASCGGVVLGFSYGDNFTKSNSSLSPGTTARMFSEDNSTPSFEKHYGVNYQQQHQQQKLLLPSSQLNSSLDSFTSSYFVVHNITTILTQNSNPDLSSTISRYSYFASIAICATDIDLIQIRSLKATVTVTRSKHSALGVGYLVRNQYLTVANDIHFYVSFHQYTSGFLGLDKSNAVFMIRFIEFAKRFKIQNVTKIDVKVNGPNQAVVGLYRMDRFHYLDFENFFNVSVISVGGSFSVAAINVAHLSNTTHGIVARNWTHVHFESNQNGLFFFFDDGLVSNFGRGILLESIGITIRVGFVANFFMSNASFSNVPFLFMRNINFAGENPKKAPSTTIDIAESGSVGFVTMNVVGGADSILVEDCNMLVDAEIALPFNLLKPRVNIYNLGVSDFVVRNVALSISASTGSSVMIASPCRMTPSGYGYAMEEVSSPAPIDSFPPVTFIDSKFTFLTTPFLCAFAVAAKQRFELVRMRNVSILNARSLFTAMLGSRAEAGFFDLSSDSPVSKGLKNSDYIKDALGAPGCSQFNGVKLFGRDTILERFTSVKPTRIIARGCGDDLTNTQTHSQTFYIPWRRTRTETNFSKTKTPSASKSLSQSSSDLPPGLDLSSSRSAAVMSTLAAATSIIGASGASVALDGARAVSLLAIVSQCSSYEKRATAQSGLSREQRVAEFQNHYLHMEPAFPENPLPFLCFGERRGACVRGGVLANLIILIVAFVVAWGVVGRVMLNKFESQLSPLQRAEATIFRFSRTPNILGLAFSFLIGSWCTNVTVLLAVPGLPDGDAMIAVVSILVFASFISYTFWIIWTSVNAKMTNTNSDGKSSSTKKRRNKKNSKMKSSSPSVENTFVTSRWQCEESMVSFDLMKNQRTQTLSFVKNKSKSKNNNKSDSTSSSSFLENFITLLSTFLQSKYGRYFGIGELVWIEKSKDELLKSQREHNEKNKKSSSSLSNGRRVNERTGMVFSSFEDDKDDREMLSRPFLASHQHDDDDDDILLGSDAFSHRLRSYKNSELRKQKQQQRLLNTKSTSRPSSSSKSNNDKMSKPSTSEDRRNNHPSSLSKLPLSNDSSNNSTSSFTGKSKANNESSSSASLSRTTRVRARSIPPVPTLSSANGEAGSLLWNFGSLINKNRGPFLRDKLLEDEAQKREEREDIEHRHHYDANRTSSSKSKSKSDNTRSDRKNSFKNSNNNNNNSNIHYDLSRLGGVPTRRYYHNDLRLRIAPYYTLVSLAWTMITTTAQGVALSNPDNCGAVIITIAVINVLSFLVDSLLRPFIVPFRNHAMIVAGFFLSAASLMAAIADKEAISNPDSYAGSMMNAFVMTFLFILVGMSVVIVFFSKVAMILTKGTLLVRRDVVKKLDVLFADAEENLMEKVLTNRLMTNKQKSTTTSSAPML